MAFVIPKNPQVMEYLGAIFAAANGLQEQEAGEVASDIAVDTVCNMYYRADSNDVVDSLLHAIRRANVAIQRQAAANALRRGMGTTLIVAVLRGNMAYIANVGNCRAYLMRSGWIKQLSQDHTWIAEQVRAGLLTEDQARTHTQRDMITRSLGTQTDVQVDVFYEEFKEQDSLVLCTDGLSEPVSDDVILRIVDNFVPKKSVYRLVECANENGGLDNITATVVHVLEVGEEPPSHREM